MNAPWLLQPEREEDGTLAGFRISRDREVPIYGKTGTQTLAEHLEVDDSGSLDWYRHEPGGFIPVIPLVSFIDWLENGGE